MHAARAGAGAILPATGRSLPSGRARGRRGDYLDQLPQRAQGLPPVPRRPRTPVRGARTSEPEASQRSTHWSFEGPLTPESLRNRDEVKRGWMSRLAKGSGSVRKLTTRLTAYGP